MHPDKFVTVFKIVITIVVASVFFAFFFSNRAQAAQLIILENDFAYVVIDAESECSLVKRANFVSARMVVKTGIPNITGNPLRVANICVAVDDRNMMHFLVENPEKTGDFREILVPVTDFRPVRSVGA